MKNGERPENLKLFSNGFSLKGLSVLHHVRRDYMNKVETMPWERGWWGGNTIIIKKKNSGKHKL